MGGTIGQKRFRLFIRDENDNLVLDGSATTIFTLQLEGLTRVVSYDKKNPIGRIVYLAMEDSVDYGVSDGDILLEDGMVIYYQRKMVIVQILVNQRFLDNA